MTIYYQHVGEVGSARDFPRSLGTNAEGLKRFRLVEIEPFIKAMLPSLVEVHGDQMIKSTTERS